VRAHTIPLVAAALAGALAIAAPAHARDGRAEAAMPKDMASKPDTAAAYDRGMAAFGERDYAETLDELLPLAQAGDGRAQTVIGIMYRTGLLGLPDHDEAAVWFEAAASHGDADAQYNLGLMYFQREIYAPGRPATPEALDAAAFEMFHDAAAQGHAEAQLYLGYLYQRGRGVDRDEVEAYKWFQVAAWQRNGLAASARDGLAASLDAVSIAEGKDRARAFTAKPAEQARNGAVLATETD